MSLFSSKAKNEIEKLVEENDELKNTLHQLLQKHKSLIDLEKRYDDTKKDFEEITFKSETAKQEQQTISNDLLDKQNKIEELNQTILKLKDQEVLLENSIQNFESESIANDSKMQEIAIKENELLILEDKIEAQQELFNDLTKKIEELREEEERIQNDISKHDETVEDSLKKIKAAEEVVTEKLNQLKTEEQKKSAAIKQLDEKITLSEEIKTNLESSLSAIVGQLSEKEKLFNEFSEKRDSLLDELRTKQKEFDEFDNKYKFAKDTLSKLESEADEISEKKLSLQEDISKYESIKNELQEKVLAFKNEEDNLKSSIEQKQAVIETLDKRKIELDENHLQTENYLAQVFVRFNEEFTTHNNKLATIRQDLIEREKELSIKEKILLEKTTQVAEYGGLAKVFQKEKASNETQINNLKEEISLLTNDLYVLREELTKNKILISQTRSEVLSLENRKNNLQRELNELIIQMNNEYSLLLDNKTLLSAEILEKSKELSELTDQTAGLRAQLLELKNETAKIETQKEEFTAKVSELIAMEKNLRFKIMDFEKKAELNKKDEIE